VGKRRNIERIDKEFFGPIAEVPQDGTTLAVSCDHATPCTLKMHSSDPVPLLVAGTAGEKGQRACRFTERQGRQGSMGTLAGRNVLRTVLEST